jgi:hypothetical protein
MKAPAHAHYHPAMNIATIFGTPAADVMLQELALETFSPADAPTAAALRQLVPRE